MEVVARNREERRLEEEAIEIERRKQDAILADLREQEILSARNQQLILKILISKTCKTP